MTLTIKIKMDNAAFHEGLEDHEASCMEVGTILKNTFTDPDAPLYVGDTGRLTDTNGNTCGEWKVTR